MNEDRARWLEQIGVAKLILTLAFAASGSIVAWLFRAMTEGSTRFFWLAVIGAVIFAVVALASFVWTLRALSRLKGEN